MKITKKYLYLGAVISAFLAVSPLKASSNIMVKIDNKNVAFTDAKPYIANNRTLVPIRFVSEELGAKVQWDNKSKVVTINLDNTEVQMQIGSKNVKINGVSKAMDTTPEYKNNRVFVPLRYISEGLKVGVEWLPKVSTVEIYSGAAQEEAMEQDELKVEKASKYKLTGTISDYTDVNIVSKADFPIDLGNHIIYDVYIDNGSIFVVDKPAKEKWGAIELLIGDNTGLNRGRRAVNSFKNSKGIITAQYDITSLSDYQIDGEKYNKFSVNEIKYLAFRGDGALLAIPVSEVRK